MFRKETKQEVNKNKKHTHTQKNKTRMSILEHTNLCTLYQRHVHNIHKYLEWYHIPWDAIIIPYDTGARVLDPDLKNSAENINDHC